MAAFTEPRLLARNPARRRSLARLFLLVAAATLAGVLGACGGGGRGGAAPASPPAPTPAPAPSSAPDPPVPIAAQLTVPAPVGYDADRLAAFDRLNAIRLSAGLGMLAQNVSMDQAAQAHAQWMVVNDSFTHEELSGTVGFTGTNWARRDETFGYVPLAGDEVMTAPAHGAEGVDGLINTLYHRAAMLAFEPVDVGLGWTDGVAAHVAMPLVIDMTRPGTDAARGLGQAAQASIRGVAIWPLDGAVGVPLRLGLESPNPVPTQRISTLGTPVSLTVAESRTISADSFVLTDRATGAVVPTRIVTNQDDPNFLLPESFIAAIPLAALSPRTTYSVSFSGKTVGFPSGSIEALTRLWSFTTADASPAGGPP